ncbi:hypothetical protein [Rheinheimera hassiensis]|uniref:hypothetical protein n=1 Tax=Rheinheimera hassiensis TaxID=1193627 RepID=UPI001F06050B|nr:hypothetical protein [Rheinheimera hassiensis]
MKYQIWLTQLSLLVKSMFENVDGWESWDDWQGYFNQGVSPEQALADSHRSD